MKPLLTLILNSNKKITAIQQEFNLLFPFLKLEFFKHSHKIHDGSLKRDLIKTDLQLSQLTKKPENATITITEDMPVSALEQLFEDQFGISAQVFRKSGKSWLETSLTDDWTLKRQNDEGKELSYLA